MTRTAEQPMMTYAEYVAAEAESETKHEWLRGEVFAMAGGTPEHAILAMSVGSELRAGLKGKPCGVFSSDLRVKVLATGLAARGAPRHDGSLGLSGQGFVAAPRSMPETPTGSGERPPRRHLDP